MIPFHISLAVADLEATRNFYHNVLGCKIGREAETWLDINFFGHQITAQEAPSKVVASDKDWQGGRKFPVRHFGVVLSQEKWVDVKNELIAAGITWIIKPQVFFQGEVNEQCCMFIEDPDGYAIEFKTFLDQDNLFKQYK